MGGMSKERIAFIGTGVMGKSMAGHLLNAGYPVSVYNRTKSKTDDLVARGAEWREAPADAAADAAFADLSKRALDTWMQLSPVSATPVEVLMIEPPPPAIMCGATALIISIVPRALT